MQEWQTYPKRNAKNFPVKGGSPCRNDDYSINKTIAEYKCYSGWVSMAGMVGPHKKEWWVHMLRNLQSRLFQKPGNFDWYLHPTMYFVRVLYQILNELAYPRSPTCPHKAPLAHYNNLTHHITGLPNALVRVCAYSTGWHYACGWQN